ncbi:MAG: hypothetical protein AB1546_15620, partial [bacterium]
AGDKVWGAWFDQINCDPDVYVEQAVQSVLAGAPELILFHYDPKEFTNENAARLREKLPVLFELARRIRGIEPVGIPAYKPPNSAPQEEHFIFDNIGMFGLPLVPTAAFPYEAKVVFLPVHAASDPDIAQKIRGVVNSGGTVLMTSGLLDALKDDSELMALAGYPASGGFKKAPRHALNFVVGGREVRAKAQAEIGGRLNPDSAEVLAVAKLTTTETPLITRHRAPGGGKIIVFNTRTFNYDEETTKLTVAQYAFMMNLPGEVVQVLRDEITEPLGIRLIAPTRVAMYLYGDKFIVLENFNDNEVNIELEIGEGFIGQEINALRPVLPQTGATIQDRENRFPVHIPARDFVMLEIE